MLSDITQQELSTIVDAVAYDLLRQVGISGPPVDTLVVARALGIVVVADDRQQGRARFVRVRGPQGRSPRPTILVRSDERFERQQWSVAHEIGEFAAVYVFGAMAIDPREAPPDARETVANRLAGRLLLPIAWFAPDAAACGWDLLALKRRYRTASHELIARRMLELSVPVIISIFDQGRLTLRRANVPGRVPLPSEAERRCWSVVHRENHPEQISEGARLIQAWPVHEPEWKREILRTEVELEPVS